MLCKEPLHVILVLCLSDGAGAVEQYPTRLHIVTDHIKNLPLQKHQLPCLLLRHLVADVRLFGHNAKS